MEENLKEEIEKKKKRKNKEISRKVKQINEKCYSGKIHKIS